MVEKQYFFDSYALIELLKANPKYAVYHEATVTITLFNLIEVTYSVLNDHGEEEAKKVYEQFSKCVEEVDQGIIIFALKMKQKYKKRDWSYADCVGYSLAKKKGIRFLTGDKEFVDIENVEFVPK